MTIALDRPRPLAVVRRHRLARAVAWCLLFVAVVPGATPFATPHGTLAYAVGAVDASTRVRDDVDLPLLTAWSSALVRLELASNRVESRAVVYGWRSARPAAHAELRL